MAGVILCKDSRFRFVYHYRIIGLVYMKDKFFLMHMMPIVRAHIAIFDENGNVKEQLSESREEDLKLYSEIIKKSRKDFPYIILIDTGVVVCVMWNEQEKEFIVIGKTALYSEFENRNQDILECPKDT